MKPAAAWTALALLAVIVEGALAQLMPLRFLPDLSLLAVVAAALRLPAAPALLAAAVIGLGTDMLSGSLLGQHAFLRLLELVLTRGVAGQLDLRRPLPAATFSLALVGVDAVGLVALSRLFLGDFPVAWAELGGLATRALATAVFAPGVLGLAERVVEGLSESERRREMRLDTRRPVL